MQKPSICSLLPEIMTVHTIVRCQVVEKNWLFVKALKTALKDTHLSKIVEKRTKSSVYNEVIYGCLCNPIHNGIEANPLISLVSDKNIHDQLLTGVLCKQASPGINRDLNITRTILNSNGISFYRSDSYKILVTRFFDRKIQRRNVGWN